MIDLLTLISDRHMEAHSSIVLTYALDLVLYDGFLRRQLRTAGAKNQIVFCDGGCYETELSKIEVARQMGRSYSCTPVHHEAAFHPKVYLLLGAHRGRLLLGSGNATLGGLTRNAELFGVFDFDDQRDTGPHPAFVAIVSMIQRLSQSSSSLVRLQLERAIARSPWLKRVPVDDARTVLVSGPGIRSMLDQIRETIGPAPLDDLLVCSASFDRQLIGLERLAQLTKSGQITCLVQPGQTTIDGVAVKKLGRKVRWRQVTLRHLRHKTDSGEIFCHAKLLVMGR